jgi:hypothetical protein
MSVMALHGAQHLALVAVVRIYEVRADEQKNDIRFIQILVDGIAQFCPSRDASVVPSRNDTLALQGCQVDFKLIAQLLVLMGIGEKQRRHPVITFFHRRCAASTKAYAATQRVEA